MAARTATKGPKEVLFIWEGTDRKGVKVKGETRARTLTLAKASLRRQGIRTSKIRKKPASLFGSGGSSKIKAGEIAVFSRQLSTLVSAGVPLVQGLAIIAEGQENMALKKIVTKLAADLEGGSSLSAALSRHPKYFDSLFCDLVGAGESAGALDTMLDKIALYKEKTESIKKKIKKAMFYPIAVCVVAIIVTSILLIFVVPQFEEMFHSMGAELPAFTQMVVNASHGLARWWYVVFGGMAGFVMLVARMRRKSPEFARWMDKTILKAPVVGSILRRAAIARFARTLSTTFTAGVPLVEGLESVAGTAGNLIYHDAILRIRELVATGERLQTSMYKSNLFPPMVVQMVGIGEESGTLDDMLSKVADFYEEEVDNEVDALSSLMEPIIMVVLGILLGGLILAMYLPLFQMGGMV
jgi:type IV pilus assembly protein PilC